MGRFCLFPVGGVDSIKGAMNQPTFLLGHLSLIRVAVDFSAAARSALTVAAELAQQHGARLEVVHVVNNQAVAQIAQARQSTFEREAAFATEGAAKALAQWLASAQLGVAVTSQIQVATPVEALLDAAAGADLLVLGASGGGGAKPGAGSVGPKIVRKAKRPVLLVPQQVEAARFATVVAAVDFSAHSLDVLQVAERFSSAGRAGLRLLHIWHQPWEALSYLLPVAEAPADLHESYAKSVEADVQAFVAEHGWGDVTIALHEAARAAEGIVEYATEAEADLVVIGAHGQSDLRHFLLGSTAEAVLKELNRPLLIVKLQDE
jgi:nucleotide-binding universal stress UspA family protein